MPPGRVWKISQNLLTLSLLALALAPSPTPALGERVPSPSRAKPLALAGWSDDFINSTLVAEDPAHPGTTAILDGALQLAPTGTMPPYVSSGSIYSLMIDPIPASKAFVNPDSIFGYAELLVDAELPAGTSAKVQLYNGDITTITAPVPNTILPGNESGFALTAGRTTINVSAYTSTLGSTPSQTEGRVFLARLKATMTGNGTATPKILRWELTWNTVQGEQTPSGLAGSAWPTWGHDAQGTFRSPYAGPPYPALKSFWRKAELIERPDGLIVGSRLSTDSQGRLLVSLVREIPAILVDKTNGLTVWTSPPHYSAIRSNDLQTSASASGALYSVDQGKDYISVRSENDGIVQKAKRTNTGHMWSAPTIDASGNLTWFELGDNPGVHAPGVQQLGALVSSDNNLNQRWGAFFPMVLSHPWLAYGHSNLALSPDGSSVYFTLRECDGPAHPTGVHACSSSSLIAPCVFSTLCAYDTATGLPKWPTLPDGLPMGGPAAGFNPRILVGTDGAIYVGTSCEWKAQGPCRLQSGEPPYPIVWPQVLAVSPDGTTRWTKTLTSQDFGGFNAWFLDLQALGTDRVLGLVSDGTTRIFAFALSLDDGSLLWRSDLALQGYLRWTGSFGAGAGIADQGNGFYYSPWNYTAANVSVYVEHIGSSGSWRWKIRYPPHAGETTVLSNAILDETGRLIVASSNGFAEGSGLAVVESWTLAGSADKSSCPPGSTVLFEAVSTMPATNPMTGAANQVQVRFEIGDRVPLAYTFSDGAGSHWSASFVLPTHFSGGNYPYRFDAAQDNVSTDIATNFPFPPTASGNTGITFANASCTLEVTARSAIIDPALEPGRQ